jgi:serine/threonine protein kinase
VQCEVIEEPPPPTLQLEAGDRIPRNARWRAVTRLGGPDHGPVWLAQHEKTGEQRVYKFATEGLRLRTLQREEMVAAILEHTGAPASSLRRLEESSFSAVPYYIAGEYIGPSLLGFAATEEFTAMSRGDKVSLLAGLADSVAAAHAVGVLHNDLKPSNVLVRRLPQAGSDAPVNQRYAMVLIDFGESLLLDGGPGTEAPRAGYAETLSDTEGESSGTIGSAMYRAPELRLGGRATVEVDIYSLGVMLYQMVAGNFQQVPSAGWQQDVLDPLLEEDIAQAANRDPRQRFSTAAALAEHLHSLEQRRHQLAEREQARLRMLQVQRDLDRARAARPWIAAALVALIAGVLISAWFYHSAVLQRNLAQRENRSLAAMLAFLSEDVLSQSNPASGVPGSSHAVDLTLSDAILNAVPQIDRRFPHDPMVAGKLHETIADGLRSRTQFVQADRQYDIAAKKYRSAQGDLSQAAIAVELKRDATQLAGLLPGAVAKARVGFDHQVSLIRQLPHPEPVVLVLQDFVESGLLGLGPDPAKAIAPLQRAIQRAEATPDFDPMLLLWINGRYCGLFVRMQDGPRLQAAAQERIQDISARYGKDSPMLVSYEIYLQEAFYLQGEYKQAIQQADRNYPRFQRLLGERSQYTLAVLANRAASLAQLGRYPEAVQDDLRLYTLEAADPSGFRLKLGSLSDAALFACRSGQFRQGLENARRVLRQTGPGPNFMPGYVNASRFIVAECLVDEQELSPKPNSQVLATAESLLKQVDPNVIAQQTGDTGYAAFVEVTSARVALLQHDYARAALELDRAAPYFTQPGSDPYELQQYRRLKDRVAPTSAAATPPPSHG